MYKDGYLVSDLRFLSFFTDKEESIAVYDTCQNTKGINALSGWYDFTIIPITNGVQADSLFLKEHECLIPFMDEEII